MGTDVGIRFMHFDFNKKPFMVIWEVTYSCDLACKHCRANSSPFRDPDELSFDEAKSLLDDIESFGKPYPLVILTGGDPFKREDIFDIVDYGVKKGLPISLSPSVTPLFGEKEIVEMKKRGVKAISISLDGASEQTHDSFRGVNGVFQRTMLLWDACRKNGLKIQINTTVTNLNKTELADIFSIVQEKGAMTWSLFFLVKVGRAEDSLQISPQEYEDVMNFLYDAGHFVYTKTTEGHQYKRIFLQRMSAEKLGEDFTKTIKVGDLYFFLREKLTRIVKDKNLKAREPRTPMNINSGKGFVFVSKLGQVFPSGFLPISCGNIREKPLSEIYRQNPLMRNLRKPELLEGRCGRCNYKNICGGSRARAYSYKGNPFSEDPSCIWEQ